MKRLALAIAALIAAVAISAPAAPSAPAATVRLVHDTGWHDKTCATPFFTITADIRVLWFSDGHRFWSFYTLATDRAGHTHTVSTAWYAKALGGAWALRHTGVYPRADQVDWTVYTPYSRPGQAHYFEDIAVYNGYRCTSAAVLS